MHVFDIILNDITNTVLKVKNNYVKKMNYKEYMGLKRLNIETVCSFF